MNIGLDWDDTVTRDLKAYAEIVKIFRNNGHKVYIITLRTEQECARDPAFADFRNLVDGVVACSRKAKRAVSTAKGIFIDVWIDDTPMFIDRDFTRVANSPIEWTSVRPPSSRSSYTHCEAVVGPCQFRIEWKSWKQEPDFDLSVSFTGATDTSFHSLSTLDSLQDAKDAAHDFLLEIGDVVSSARTTTATTSGIILPFANS